MSRPVYERTTDRENEQRCARMLAGLGFTVFQLGKFGIADFMAYNGRPYLVEYKKRHHNFGRFPTVIIPLAKLTKCFDMAHDLKCGFLYICEFNDGFYMSEPREFKVSLGGRVDRGDPKDIYEVAHIGLDKFRKVHGYDRLC